MGMDFSPMGDRAGPVGNDSYREGIGDGIGEVIGEVIGEGPCRTRSVEGLDGTIVSL
jgi:hypothetical protein